MAKEITVENMMDVENLDGGLSALTDVLDRHWRIDLWIASWLDVICGLISVVTLTYFRPIWDFDFRCWSSKRRIRKMMSSNDSAKGRA